MSADGIQDDVEDALQHPATVALMEAAIGHNLTDVVIATVSILAQSVLLSSTSIEDADSKLTALMERSRKEMHMNKDLLSQFQNRKSS